MTYPHHAVFSESDSHFAPDPEALRDTLREPLPPKHSVMPPKWLMGSTPEPGGKASPRTPSNHPTTQYSSPSAPSAAASKPVRSVSSAGASTQPSSLAPAATSQGTKQPPLPPPKPVSRSNAPMLGKFSGTAHINTLKRTIRTVLSWRVALSAAEYKMHIYEWGTTDGLERGLQHS